MPTNNKLVWLLIVLLGFAVVVVAINAMNEPDQKKSGTVSQSNNPAANNQPNKAVPVKEVTGDTVGETLKDVQLRYEAEKQQRQALEEKLAAIDERLVRTERKTGTANKEDDKYEKVNDDVNAMRDIVDQVKGQMETQEQRLKTMIPNGYEFSDSELGIGGSNNKNKDGEVTPQTTLLPGYVAVKPLSNDSRGLLDNLSANELRKLSSSKGLSSAKPNDKTLTEKGLALTEKKKKYKGKPFYTIPARATLMDATAMTAIIGSVPIGGRVRDPFPVKIILGDDNLATNGLTIPGLKGIVFEGMATGNWNLSCASVTLTGATFTFQDGRVQHLPNKDKTEFAGQQDGQLEATPFGDPKASGVDPIGYISNPQGVQCIGGKRISDAPQQIATLATLGAALTYFESLADAETTTVTNGESALEAVTGDDVKFANNKTAAGGVQTAIEFYKERTRDSFDVIFVPPNQKVSLHITRDLYVDYNPDSRKLVYSQGEKNVVNRFD